MHFGFQGYDPDLFWDIDGKSYVTAAHFLLRPGMDHFSIDLDTGAKGETVTLWNGTGGQAPEGPHLYLKDGWYYLLIAEGGTGLNHSITMARSKNLNGPYTPAPNNPILTNAGTDEYFQTVGHGDLFQDPAGNWWGVALSTRSGPEFVDYPMGRETVLYPVTWNKSESPVATQVRGVMSGWPLPNPWRKSIPQGDAYINAPDYINFSPRSQLPAHFIHWRVPDPSAYTIAPPGHPNSLRLTLSSLNLTGTNQDPRSPRTLVARRQTDTLFTYSVDMEFLPQKDEEEAGVSLFLTQEHHFDLGIVRINGVKSLRLRAVNLLPPPSPWVPPPTNWIYLPDTVVPIKKSWSGPLRMQIQAYNETHYAFSAGPARNWKQSITVGYLPASLVSAGYTGTLVGVFASSMAEAERQRRMSADGATRGRDR